MRGAPQVEFSCAIVWIMDRISPDVVGLPTVLLRERRRQYRRKPCRCHPTTVSGLTIRSDLVQCGHKWRSRIQNSRSERCNRGRLVRRFKTINWCRKATISSPRSWRDRTKLCSQVNTAVISPCINSRYIKMSARTAEMFTPDGILATYNPYPKDYLRLRLVRFAFRFIRA